MSEDAIPNSPGRPRAFNTIVYGGLVVGVLDILDAMIFFGLRLHASPIRIWQSVAVGVLGRAAYSGGLKTALLGLALHFLNATLFAAGYYVLSSILPVLNEHAVIVGLLYGVAAFFIMTYIVVPLSAVGPRSTWWIPAPVLLNGIIGHALLVGLPIALIARRSAEANKRKALRRYTKLDKRFLV